MEQLIADVLERDDVIGNDFRVYLRGLGLPADEEPLDREGPDLARLYRLVDHPQGQQVGDVADDDAADGQHPPLREGPDDEDHGRPQQQPEKEAEILDEAQLLLADLEEHPVGQGRVGLDVADHHQLHVQQLIYVLADLVGHRTHHAGQLLLNAGVDGVADELGQAAPAADPRAP